MKLFSQLFRNKKKPRLAKYLLLSALIFVVAVLASISTRILLTFDVVFYHFPDDKAETVISIIDGVVGAIAAGLVLYQLKINYISEVKQNNIEEAQFILQYNQAFIQDSNMCYVEKLLEDFMLHKTDILIINDENRQLFINYLVYLEGLAPLILRDVLLLEHVDDLFAFRFFLAMNNKEIQEDQLFVFPDYYRGCFKLYEKWKSYRRFNCLDILMEENSIDKWVEYEKYTESPIYVRSMQDNDDKRAISKLIYYTDKYIYPPAFKKVRIAMKVFSDFLLNQKEGLFSQRNILVATKYGHVVGISVVLDTPPVKKIDCDQLMEKYKSLPLSFRHVTQNYFNNITSYIDKDTVYILCISVHYQYRRQRVGEILIKNILQKYPGKKIKLHVLCDNVAAINLYKKYGFVCEETTQAGYAYNTEKPLCYEMTYNSRTS
mgnify:CR=1 FL=1